MSLFSNLQKNGKNSKRTNIIAKKEMPQGWSRSVVKVTMIIMVAILS